MEFIHNIALKHDDYSVFSEVGERTRERTREGNGLYYETMASGVSVMGRRSEGDGHRCPDQGPRR